MVGNPDFDLFQLPEEHQALREAIRALAEKEIAPYAKEVDEKARFPRRPARHLSPAVSTPSTCPSSSTAREATRSPRAS